MGAPQLFVIDALAEMSVVFAGALCGGWTRDARFESNRARLAHKAELFALLGPILQARTRAEWMARVEAAGVPCAPVHSVPEALVHPQAQAQGMQAAVPGADFVLTALPLRIDGERPLAQGRAPGLGEHNARHGAAAPPGRLSSETP